MIIKTFLKRGFLRLRLWNVNYKNLHHLIHIGRFSIIKTDKHSYIHLNKNIVINDYVKVIAEYNGTIILGEKINIGDYSSIRASAGASIIIGSNTMLAQYVILISTNHAYKDKNKFIHQQGIDGEKKGINIGSDCWLAAGCVILPGVTIGNGVVIGASAVVTKNIPDFAVVVGNPARIIYYRN